MNHAPDVGPPVTLEDNLTASLNMTFRSLYGANRDQVLAETPLFALTLIGTAEIWRFEYGELVKCYKPNQLLPDVKGLMHAVLGAHGTWRQLQRNADRASALQAAKQLNEALEKAIESVSSTLPAQLASPTRDILVELKKLSDEWSSGQPATAEDFSTAIRTVSHQLREILSIVGNAAYVTLTDGFEALKRVTPSAGSNVLWVYAVRARAGAIISRLPRRCPSWAGRRLA